MSFWPLAKTFGFPRLPSDQPKIENRKKIKLIFRKATLQTFRVRRTPMPFVERSIFFYVWSVAFGTTGFCETDTTNRDRCVFFRLLGGSRSWTRRRRVCCSCNPWCARRTRKYEKVFVQRTCVVRDGKRTIAGTTLTSVAVAAAAAAAAEEKEGTGGDGVQRARRSNVKCRPGTQRGHRKSRTPNRVLRARAGPRDGRELVTGRGKKTAGLNASPAVIWPYLRAPHGSRRFGPSWRAFRTNKTGRRRCRSVFAAAAAVGPSSPPPLSVHFRRYRLRRLGRWAPRRE